LVNEEDGILLLSEYAGAYYELGEHAFTISPYDIYGTVENMHKALTMSSEERKQRATSLRNIVKAADVKEWFYAQVDDAIRDMQRINEE
jgi:trehalose 6-phosphate synthase